MTQTISRRALMAGLGSALAAPALADAPLRSIRPAARAADIARRTVTPAEALIAKAELGGKVGFVVADARTGRVLETRNPLLALPPASVAKVVTAAYGMDVLGGGYRFPTRLIATGPVRNGRLEGDLVLTGGGDPTLDTNALADMAAQLKAAGVNEVRGRFRVYAGALPYVRVIDPAQPDHLGYNPAISGVNLNFNRVYFEWKRVSTGYTVSMDARSEKYRPEVGIAQMRIVDRDMPVYTYSDGQGIDKWTVAKGALGKGGSRWLPVRRPDLYAAEVFQSFAGAHGIRLNRASQTGKRPNGTVLVQRDSASLTAICRLMLKYSTNLTAEVIGLSASAARGGNPRSLSASAREMSAWMNSGLGADRARFLDHSGLNDGSRVSASDMVKALVRAGAGGALHGLMKDVPPVDVDGKPDADARHTIRAKTGTLNFVSSLAGYVTAGDGTPLAFAVFTADMPRRDRIKRSERERPPGARGWSRRSRWLQHQLVNRWAALYGS